MATINLGDRVRDSVTGYAGIVIGRTHWLFGCTRITVQAQELHEGKPVEMVSFDEPQLVLIDAGVVPTQEPSPAPPGGPRPTPTQRATPSR